MERALVARRGVNADGVEVVNAEAATAESARMAALKSFIVGWMCSLMKERLCNV